MIAFITLWLRSGIEHPFHAAAAIFAFALIYIGIGAFIGALVHSSSRGHYWSYLVFSVDAFSGPTMTSSGGLLAYGPTRVATQLLIAAGSGVESSLPGHGYEVLAAVFVALSIALGAFLLVRTIAPLRWALEWQRHFRWACANSGGGHCC